MSEAVEMTECDDKESQENVMSTVEAQYELFNKELGLDETKDKDKDKEDTAESQEKTEKMEKTEKTEKTESSDTPEASEVKEEEKEPDVEEPDSDDEVIEDDVDEWDGEDPTEAEVEQFCLPPEQLVLADLNDQVRRRRVIVYPLKIGELGHPSVIEVMKNCLDFKTTFVHCKLNESDEEFSFRGLVEFSCKSTVAVVEALETLKSIREDVTVRIMEPGEMTKKLMQNWTLESSASPSTAIQNLLIVKPLSNEITVEQIRELFPDAFDIVIAKPKFFPKLAYVSYDESSALDEVVNWYKADRPAIGERRLKVLKYQPPYLPAGFLKMKRRYRILLQIQKLQKALKNSKANYSESQRKKMTSTIEHCTALIDKDNAVRMEIGLKAPVLKELQRIRKIRESVKLETIWLPRLPGDKREDHGKIDLGEDDDKESFQEKKSSSKFSGKRYDRNTSRSPSRGRWHDSRGSSSGVPSLLSMPMGDPSAQVSAVCQKLVALSNMLPYSGFGGMRGGMNRGRGGPPHGRFGPGRGGGFVGGDMDPDFGPPGGSFGPRRGGGYGGFNKRPRQNSSSERELWDGGRDELGAEEGGCYSEDAMEPSGKIPKQNWSADAKNKMKPTQQQGFSGPGGDSRGRQSSWTKPPSKFSSGGSSSGSGGFKQSKPNQGGFKRGGNHSGGFGQGGFSQGSGGYNQGGGGGGPSYGPSSGGFSQGHSSGYNQGPGSSYDQGQGTGFSQGPSAGYSPTGGAYNQGTGGAYNQGSSGYGQDSSATYNQGNAGQSNVGYNQSVDSYNQASGYNQTGSSFSANSAAYNQGGYQQNTGSYGGQSAGYSYNYSSQSSAGTGYQASPAPVPPVASQQSWNAPSTPGQTYWQQQQQQQPSQGTWQPAANATAQQAQSTDQSAYGYGWNTWK